MKDDYDGRAPPELYTVLFDLKAACGPTANKHDIAIVLIEACIDNGWDTRSQIVGALREQGLNYRHVNITLNKGTGTHPKGFRWYLDTHGRYRLLDPAGIA